jgi:hypothetical protein
VRPAQWKDGTMTEDPKSKRQQDQELDQELKDSFPASDPPSSTTPGGGPGAPDHDENEGDRGRDAEDCRPSENRGDERRDAGDRR